MKVVYKPLMTSRMDKAIEDADDTHRTIESFDLTPAEYAEYQQEQAHFQQMFGVPRNHYRGVKVAVVIG